MPRTDQTPSPDDCADRAVLNGRIYTVNQRQPWAQALAIRDGRIVAVGSEADIRSFIGSTTDVIDAGGKVVLPGLTDTHVHLSLEPTRDRFCEFSVYTIAEAQAALRERTLTRPDEPSVLAWALLAEQAATMTRHEIDAVIANRPVVIFDGHRGYANTEALQGAGITRTTPDPDGGEIYRDAATGEPSGVLDEAAARLVLSHFKPIATRDMAIEGYRRVFHDASKYGLVRLHSAGYDSADIEIFDELRREDELPVRLLVSTVVEPPSLREDDLGLLEATRQRYCDDWLDAGAVKFFQDGIVETHTAAMLQPYRDAEASQGGLRWHTEPFREAVEELNRRDFHILAHSTGDRSAREILDAYSRARAANGRSRGVLRVEHAEHVSDPDVGRFASLGVIASMHPMFTECCWHAQQVCLGPERMRTAYAWRSIAATGARVVFGSDFPAYTLNPWEAMHVIVEGHAIAEQRLSVAEAIEGYTLGAAYAGGREGTEGSLEAGKMADLIVLASDPFAAAPGEIARTVVSLTMVGGRIVHRQN